MCVYADSVTGNSKTTSLPVSFLYTPEKVSSLYSVVLRSLGSRNTCVVSNADTQRSAVTLRNLYSNTHMWWTTDQVLGYWPVQTGCPTGTSSSTACCVHAAHPSGCVNRLSHRLGCAVCSCSVSLHSAPLTSVAEKTKVLTAQCYTMTGSHAHKAGFIHTRHERGTHLEDLGAVDLVACALANDLSGEHQVVEHSVVDLQYDSAENSQRAMCVQPRTCCRQGDQQTVKRPLLL